MSELKFFPYEEIKKSILHPDLEIRKMAVGYFKGSFSTDKTVMPLVIEAVEKYGREDSLGLVCHAHKIAQTQQTLEWVIRELENEKSCVPKAKPSYYRHLSEVLSQTSIEFLAQEHERILGAYLLDSMCRNKIAALLKLKDADFDMLWKKLKDLCAEYGDEESLRDKEVRHECILRLLCRFRAKAAEKTLEAIAQDALKIDQDGGDPDWWMELFAIQLAGYLRLEEAVGMILDKFHDDYDYRNELCSQALIAIGTEGVVDSISSHFRGAPDTFRQYTPEVLEHIHLPGSSQACFDLIEGEHDRTIRTYLANALLSHFCYEGLDKVYLLVKKGDWDSDFCDLKEDFAWTCLLIQRKYPESDAWEKYARKQFQAREKRLKNIDWLFPSSSSSTDDEGAPVKEAVAKSSKVELPTDLRSLEKTMFNLHRALRENKVETKEQAEGVLKKMMRKIVPSFPPRDSLEAAQELVYKAFDAEDPRERIQLAREALKLSENCADAYVILGEESQDVAEKIRWYQKGVEAGGRALGGDFFKENCGYFWGIFETRPYMRARFNLAEALWYNNQKKESLGHYWELLKLNPNDNQGVRFTLAGRLLELRRYEDLKDLIENQYPDSITAEWLYTKALFYFEIEGNTERSRTCLIEAIESNKHIPDYLVGIKEIPGETTQTIRLGGEDEAVYYGQGYAELWWRNDKAMDWLERHVFAAQPYRRSENKTGRNEPCPCGSGKKYKKCCA